MSVKQFDTTMPIPFSIRQNVANYPGDAGQSLAVQLRKRGARGWVAAAGSVTDLGFGFYQLEGAAADRDTPGVVLMRIVNQPTGDLVFMGEFEVEAPSLLSQLLAIPANLASIAHNLRLLTKYQVPQSFGGQVQ